VVVESLYVEVVFDFVFLAFDDDAEVAGYTAGTVVADFAAIALRRRGARRDNR